MGESYVDVIERLAPEQQQYLKKEVEAMEARMDKQSVVDKTITAAGFPAAEVPDEATKAFIKELNKEHNLNRQSAHGFLEEASSAMKQRAALRDADDGERTAAQIAKVFNAITGHDITEADAWMFLVVLKIVRSRNGKFNRDDYVDLAAYAGLLGECESVSRKG